jgi:two-component system, NtrC family, response regulator AtoC
MSTSVEDESSTSILGSSSRIEEVRSLVRRVGKSSASILLLGETGTGKELIAHAIHECSSRRQRPFTPIDCSAIPPTLAESELFGHVKGAFTGASANKLGLIRRGNFGTVFFDEIGELPIEQQAKLLRVLQEREIRPVGGNETFRVDIRVISAANTDLAAAVRKGIFRQDLYFRLNVIQISLPPLRQRRGDIAQLVDAFLREFSGGRAQQMIGEDLLSRMMAYSWPGNIRELRNFVERLTALCAKPTISLDDYLDLGLADQAFNDEDALDPVSLKELEEKAIKRMLVETRGDKLEAARRLGIGKTTLYRKVKDMGIRSRMSPEREPKT